MRPIVLRSLAAAWLAVVAAIPLAAESSAHPGAFNLGVASSTSMPVATREWVIAPVDEREQGGADLNFDGDAIDHVLHLLKPDGAGRINLALATGDLVADDRHLLVEVSERFQGFADLNGDGDATDGVLHIYRLTDHETVNTGLAGLPLWVGREHALIAVSEPEQAATDLNGDGDADDLVFHLIELRTGEATNLRLSPSPSLPKVRGDGDAVAVRVSEHAHASDLNGDGDANDNLLGVLDLGGTAPRLRLVDLVGFLDSSVRVSSPWVTYVASGSATRKVLDLREGSTVDLGLAPVHNLVSFVDGWLVVAADERDVDLNGDGDLHDTILHAYDARTGRLWNTRRTVTTFDADGRVAAALDRDSTPYAIDRRGRIATIKVTSGFGAPDRPLVQGPWIFYSEREGAFDLNHDGDLEDDVTGVFRIDGAAARNLGLSSWGSRMSARRCGAIIVREGDQQRDLNGDGDLADSVLHLLDGERGGAVSSEVALRRLLLPGLFRARPASLLFTADERDEGRDLNGDGDEHDQVLFAACVPRRSAATVR